MLNSLKKILKGIAGGIGYDLINRKTFGYDIMRDIVTLLQATKKYSVLDIGANVGDTSIEMARILTNANIYSIEPDPKTAAILKQNTAAYPNIHVFNVGFGEVNESKILNVNKGSGGNSFLEVSSNIKAYEGDWTIPVGTVSASVQTIDSFCAEQKIDIIDLVKIDTQGYEMMILKGGEQMLNASKTKLIYIEVLFVELYKNQSFFADIFKELEKRGFKLIGFYNKFHDQNKPHHLLWCDALFGSVTLIGDKNGQR